MSAALQLTSIQVVSSAQAAREAAARTGKKKPVGVEVPGRPTEQPENPPVISLRFYRKYTERLLQRYFQASLIVGREPSILDHPASRGWASSRPVHTFEDTVIFVLDVEKCLHRLGALDRMLLARIVIQKYSTEEAGVMLGMSIRGVQFQLALALDRLTQNLLDANLLTLPQS